jgi:hypothetical protein
VRFVLAIVSFVLALGLMGWGVAQQTVFASPDEVAATGETTGDAPVTVIASSALNAFDGTQTLAVNGDDAVFAAYGRTNDVISWIGDTEYNLVTYDAESGELVSEVVPGEASEVPDPAGSDLWLAEIADEDSLRLKLNAPDGVSVIITSDGVLPAPSNLSLTWPLDNSTPWAVPVIIAGAAVLLLGLVFLLWAIYHVRSSRGPRRKQPKLPRQPRYKPGRGGRPASKVAKPGNAVAPVGGGRRSSRPLIAVPVVLIGALALSGCTSALFPEAGPPAPVPSSTAEAVEITPPAVTANQVDRIVSDVIDVATEADTAMDATLLATRFDGPALALRTTDYTVRKNDPSLSPLVPVIPDGQVEVVLPQQTDTWPRTVFAIIKVEDDETIAPVALMLTQEDPRADYKVTYAITLEPSARIPDLAPASVGAPGLDPENGLLRLAPSALAANYGEILAKAEEASAYLDFEAEGDSLRTSLKDAKAAEAAQLASTASITFTQAEGQGIPIALATNDAGAIVAVDLYDVTTVTPVEAGAAVNPSGRVKALTGLAISTKGVTASYDAQLLFYVPAAGSDEKIVLLGYSYGLVTASEVG